MAAAIPMALYKYENVMPTDKYPIFGHSGFFDPARNTSVSVTLDADGTLLSHTAGWTPSADLLQRLHIQMHPPRTDLQGIEATLPPFVEGRDRPIRFALDGTITYDKVEGVWEPPRDLEGYVRDPQDAWRFQPLWPICRLRLCTGVRLAACGCVGVIMRCNNPQSPAFGQQMPYKMCAECKVQNP